jgi:Bacterial archaeo-eukaryotic release factor family 3
MQRALLVELQAQRAYPSITILFNTISGANPEPSHLATAMRFVRDADERLRNEVTDQIRKQMVDTLTELVRQQANTAAPHAIALFASPEASGSVRLAKTVTERVIIDETFATRDLVADLNRTALYRVLCVSDQRARMFLGNRERLVEEVTEQWPITRDEESSVAAWGALVTGKLHEQNESTPLPVVFAGVARSVRRAVPSNTAATNTSTIGIIPGNHDRTGWRDLHHLAWPLVTDWLRGDKQRAMKLLEEARSQRRYAGGLEEIWSLAQEGRIEQLIVEESFAVAGTIEGNQLARVDDATAPGVVDDLVDELIELVLSKGGSTVFVDDGDLIESERLAAILRF